MTQTLASDRPSATAGAPDNQFAHREREPSQAMEALAEANRIRSAMAERKSAIAAMDTREAMRVVADLLEDPDPMTARMQLKTLLCAVPRVRVRTAEKMLTHIGLPLTVLHRQIAGEPTKRLARSLSPRQRSVIASELRNQADRKGGKPS